MIESNSPSIHEYPNSKHKLKEQIDFSIQNTDQNYVKLSKNLISHIKGTLQFLNSKEIQIKNKEKKPVIKLLKEEYDQLRNEYDDVINENLKLKDKIKQLKDNSSKGGLNNSENFNLSKYLDSLTYMQNKNQELENENKKLKAENEEILHRYKQMKRVYTEEKNVNVNKNHKNYQINSHGSSREGNKNKNEMMEVLLKQQVKCMKQMISIVQDGKEDFDDSDKSVLNLFNKCKIPNINQHEDKSDSDIHFEESFNVTNLSNSVDYESNENQG